LGLIVGGLDDLSLQSKEEEEEEEEMVSMFDISIEP
jgi:hypothetical protein